MSDKLRSYITQSKEDLDVYDFDIDQGWQELNSRLGATDQTRKLRIWKTLAVAASILLIASVSFIFMQSGQTVGLPSEVVETQMYYQQQIDQKVELVKQMSGSEQLVAEMDQLDQAFESLKADLKDDVHNEAVVTAMIDNYRLKLKVLEEILRELEEQEDESYSNI